MKSVSELLQILNRRVVRLQEEYDLKAPQIIINLELQLIADICNQLVTRI